MAIGVKFTESKFDIPAFAAEQFTADTLMPAGAKIDASAFGYLDALTVKVTSNASADATSIAVTITSALGRTGLTIPAGTQLDFGGKKLVVTTAAAAQSVTTLAVRAIPTALVANDTATYAGSELTKFIPAGTLVGRTYTERDAGTPFGVADVSTPDDQLFLIAFDVPDAVELNDIVLLRHTTRIYEDKLPGWSGLSSTAKAVIRARYQCIKSAQ